MASSNAIDLSAGSSLSFNINLNGTESQVDIVPNEKGGLSFNLRQKGDEKATEKHNISLEHNRSSGGGVNAADVSVADKRTVISDPAKAKAAIKMLGFDCLKYTETQLIELMELMFEDHGLMSEFRIPPTTLHRFLYEVRKRYNPNAYHNFHHCFDVLQGATTVASSAKLGAKLDKLDWFSLMLAAIVHDIGHTGTNNNFHVNTGSELALRYNDSSVLESMHCATAFQLLADPHLNIMCNMTAEQRKYVRKTVITLVLATDMSNHKHHQDTFAAAFDAELKGKDVVATEWTDATKMATMRVFLKMGDIANVTRPFKIADKWGKRIAEEFYSQGDLERALGMTVLPMMDRTKASGPPSNGTLGFIQFVAFGFFDSCCGRLAGTEQMIENLKSNRARWERRRDRLAAAASS